MPVPTYRTVEINMMMIHNKLLAVINKCQEYEMFNVFFADILPGVL